MNGAPQQVRMWFSEDLNPAFTTAAVVNAKNQPVDQKDAHVAAGDSKEMDISLKANLPPSVYIVIYRTDSAEDGHILRGSFIFTVANPNGSLPTLNPNTIPGQNVLSGGNPTGLYTGQLDVPTTFSLIMITLVELGAVIWVGAQLFLIFVLQLAPTNDAKLNAINQEVQQRFEHKWSVPTLLVLLVANFGVLLGQALTISGGQWGAAEAPSLLTGLISNGRFGTFWIVRMIVIAVLLALALFTLLVKQRPRLVNSVLPSINLLLGALLFAAISLSSHASAVSNNIVVLAVLANWLHLMAAALWVGGMLYITTTYLPVLTHKPVAERAHSLVTLIPYFSPLALAGVAIMAVTGPFSATIHLSSWVQLFTTAYGRALTVKILLVGLLGVGVIVCVGLMNVFAGTLTPIAAPTQPTTTKPVAAFNTTVKTTDNKFTVKLNVNPNRFGTNIFTVTVIDNSTGKPTSNVGVSLYTTMLDMDMGTDSVNLSPDGKGHFSSPGDLSMGGDWQIRIQIRTPDNTLHETKVKLFTPF